MNAHQRLRQHKEIFSASPYWDTISIHTLPEHFSEWKICIYCENNLVELDGKSSNPRWGISSYENVKLNACLFCGWWFVVDQFHTASVCRTHSSLSATRGILLKCKVDPLCRAIPALRKYIDSNPNRISSLTPLQFEVLLQDIMSNYLDCEVKWTGRGADGGFDLFAVTGDELALVQVKHRTRKRVESVQPVRELLGTMLLNRATRGIFITTAESFTRPALVETASTSLLEKGIRLDLIDNKKLLDIIRQFVPREKSYPWSGLHGLP